MTLRARVVERGSLGQGQRARMLALMQASYDGVDVDRFYRDLDDKQFVIVLEDRHGALMGFSTLKVWEDEVDGAVVDVVFSGDTVIDAAHWGSKSLQTAFGQFCLQRKLQHLGRPLFWLLLSKGFRTYLMAVNYFPKTFPQLPSPSTSTPRPSWVQLRDRIGARLWGSNFNPQREILHYETPRDRVKTPLAPPPQDALAHPAVRFFLEKNPGADAGDELVCLVPLPLTDLLRALARAGAKAAAAPLRRRRRAVA